MSTTAGAFVAGGIAACGAVTVTHGFETVKIRLQLQGELQAKADAPRLYKGVFHGMTVILKNEGFKGLLRGLSCAVSICSTHPVDMQRIVECRRSTWGLD